MELWLDVEEFEHCVEQGQRLESQLQITEAIAEYEIAINLYRGDFLAENPYEGWTVLERERLRITYLDTLDHLSQIYFDQERYGLCVTLCQLILNRDLCREDAHCRLMRCYSRLGQGPLALRQYQICAEALQTELEVVPAPETTEIYERIHRHEHI
jgi:DNA-binding SARP family transcriptional activator